MRTLNFPTNLSEKSKWQLLNNYKYNRISVVGKIVKYSAYFGFTIDVDGISAEMSAYDLSYAREVEPEKYVGKYFMFAIKKIDAFKKILILSRKLLVANAKAGDILNGFIADIDDNSLMVDVGFMCRIFKNHMRDFFIDNIGNYFDFYAPVTIMLLNDYTKQKFTSATTKESEIWEIFKIRYKVNTPVSGIITQINDNGIFIDIDDILSSFIGNNCLPQYLNDAIAAGNIAPGDTINAAIGKINEKSRTIYCSVKLLETIKDKEMVEKFNQISERGNVYEAEVIEITKKYAKVRIEDIEGYIYKDSVSWNDIERISDILYIGQIVEVVYLADDSERITFGIKQLNPYPYEESLYDLNLQNLLLLIGIKSKSFIGVAKKYGKYSFVENLYSIDEEQEGKLLVDPYFGYNLRAIVLNPDKIEEGKYYKVKITNIPPKDIRLDRNQLFQFQCIVGEEANNPYKVDVNLAFQRNTTNPASNQRDAKLLDEIGKNMYSSKDRMFFELIQNADDAASKNGVHINVQTNGDYLIIRHNGNSFDKDDFVSITTAANGTKKANENKTGYKGIGFKSVFTDSVQVFIKTGGYQFKFDRKEKIFQSFDEFYLEHNPMIINEEMKKRFLKLYSDYKKQFDKTHSIPWQIEPIWVEQYPVELGEYFTCSNVSIALNLGESKILGDNGYEQAIKEIISNPKFMLFLRNTRRIDFNGLSVSKTKNNGIITLKNSFDDNRIVRFKRIDFEIDVNNKVFEENGIDIRIIVEKRDDDLGKIIEAKFVDTHNQDFENIPKKIAINNSSTISFAVQINDDGSIKPMTNYQDVSLFAFLPTLVKDFKFPFYINANFILDPPRQRILGDNPWNFYLMQAIAKLLVRWCASLNEKKDKNALNVLLPYYFEEDSADSKQLAEHFNAAYKLAINSESFILNHKDQLSRQDEIIIDKTGLSEIIGAYLFCQVLNTKKGLPSSEIDSKILEEDVFEKIELLKFEDVIEAITDNEDFNEWFVSATDEQKKTLYKWIDDNNNASRKNELQTFVANLPLFRFFDTEYSSYRSVISDRDEITPIITTPHILPIRSILNRLDFQCSDNLFDEHHPLFKYIDLPKEEDLFNLIKVREFLELSANERKTLFFSLAEFDGVGTVKLKDIALFRNINGVTKPLGEMVAYRDNTPLWLSDYILCKEDNDADLSVYLISQEDEFASIIQEHINDIETSFSELYSTYKEEWTGQFTRQLIDYYDIDDNLLTIIEDSDRETKNYFLNSIKKLELHSTSTYKKNSYEYRVLQLALSTYDEPSVFSPKIYFDEKCIKDFSVSDEVICEYTQNGERKKVKMSLAKLLPQYQNLSDSIDKIKALFESKKDLDKFFVAKPKPLSEVYTELNDLLQITHAKSSPWDSNSGNAYQYLFSVYKRKQVWSNLFGFQINLEAENDGFVKDLLCWLYDNGIQINTSPFTCHLKKYFSDKHFDSDYIFENEQILPIIEKWADDENKIKYLKENGVQTSDSNAIQFRKLFLGDKPINFIDKLSDREIKKGIEFIATCEKYDKPFTGVNQKTILLQLRNNKCYGLSASWDNKKMEENATEWNSKEYNKWAKAHDARIFIYPGILPRKLSCKDEILLNYDDPECNYYYNEQEKKLFICNTRKLEDILFVVAKEKQTRLDFDDYKDLCLDGKISVSKEDIEKKNKTIESLEETNRKKDKIIELYRAKYGELTNDKYFPNNETQVLVTNTIENIHANAQTEIEIQKAKPIERDALSHDKQVAAHIEAENVIKAKLENDGYNCSNWILDDDNDNQYQKWHSNNQVGNIVSPEGEMVNLVVKSAKGGYIYLSATDFEYLTSDCNNILIVWDGKNVHSVSAEDIFNKDSNVNLIFDTEYTPKHYYAALCKVFQYIKRTTFAVKNPSYNAYDSIKSFGMDSKTEGVQELFDDNDL